MSQVENTLALSLLLRRFRPEYVGKNPPGLNATVTLTPKGGLKFKIHELN
jgi:cytochrome P450